MTDRVSPPTRRQFLGLSGAALLLPQASWAASLETLEGTAFGTDWRLAVPAGTDLTGLGTALTALFAEIDQQMSPWRADSDLSRFNAASAGTCPLPDEVIRVTDAALTIARHSDGRFDPTVGPLVAQWGFGPIHGGAQPDWRGISLQTGGLGKSPADLTLDLCGIAKGWALDRAMALIRNAGIGNALFDLGGELAALGTHPTGRDWQVAVENPQTNGPAPAILRLPAGRAVATSGNNAQNFQIGTRLYSHIIDPETDSPTEGRLRSVTVLADEAMTADGWATALFAAGADDGPDMARDLGLEALFLADTGEELNQIVTGGMKARLI